MNFFRTISLLFIAALFSVFTRAQTARKYSNEFLNIGVDAAAMGMANTVTPTVADVTAGYWNPAGLTHLEGNEVALMHAAWFANIAQYDYAAFAMPLQNNNAFGISLIRFGVDDILDTTQLIDSQGNIDYNRIELFSAADYGLLLSYAAKNIFKEFSYGVNLKIIHRRIGDFATSFGFGFDAGLQYTGEKWSYGLMIRDITTTYNTWNFDKDKLEAIQNAIPGQNQQLPETNEITLPKAELGISREWELNRDISLLSSFGLNMRFARTQDIINTDYVSISPALGFQAGYLDFVFLRAGINNIQEVTLYGDTRAVSWQPNMGAGFLYNGIQVDYALTNIASTGNALYSHVFSIKIDLDAFR